MIDSKATHAISYGLFVLTTREGEKDCGCIINTAQQISSDPLTMAVTVNKANYTHDMILCSKKFCVSVIDESADFELFKRFGFQSGRTADKFQGMTIPRTQNGLPYVTESCNAYFSCIVTQTVDCGTHTLFIAKVTEAKVISDRPSATYAYYHAKIKPSPAAKAEKKTGWICKICNYVYEGEELPADYICPLCKHGPEDFERLA